MPSFSATNRRSFLARGATGVLAAADVYTASTAFIILESIRLDLGIGSQIHP
jgi:hypothetical protein